MISSDETQKLALAIELTKSRLPLLLPLLDKARISFDNRIDTACVYPSGRILISPLFTANLGSYELSYIISHELLHLYYKSAEQGREFKNPHLVNVAHDFIINGRLSCEYMMIPPNDGLDWMRYDSLVYDLIRHNVIDYHFDCLDFDGDYYDEFDHYDEEFEDDVEPESPVLVPEELRPQSYSTIRCWKRVSTCSTEILFAILKNLSEWLKNNDSLRKKYSSEHPFPAFVPPTKETPSEEETPPEEGTSLGKGAFDCLNPADFGSEDESANSVEDKPEAQDAENSLPTDSDDGQTTSDGHSPEIHIHCLESLLAHDVRELDDELVLFPEASLEELQSQGQLIAKTVADMAEVTLLSNMLQRADQNGTGGSGTSAASWEIKVLNGNYSVPWERALQRWMDETAPRMRSWTSASRRLGDRRDICLPGRARNGVTAFFILDTSGSMEWALPEMLGALSTFCQNNDVESVRLLQCDTDVCFDEMIEIGELSSFHAFGGGGSDMSPAMMRLAEDCTVQSVIVLTDGEIDYPEDVPYDVLWVLPESHTCFTPPYGTVISMQLSHPNEEY